MDTEQKRAYWAGVIDQQAGSGQSIKLWCETHDIKEGQYYAWKARLRAQESSATEPADAFIALDLPASGKLSVSFGQHIRVEAEGACSLVHLRTALEVLSGSRRCWR
jgi:hypothetical protein